MDNMNNQIIRMYSKDEEEYISAWLESLEDVKARIQIFRRLDRFKFRDLRDYMDIGKGLFELRVDYGPIYCICFAIEESGTILLLCGGELSERTMVIEKAKEYLSDYLKNKKDVYYREYDEFLLERLMLVKEAQQHLETAIEEFIDDRDRIMFLRALREVSLVYGGIARLSERTKLNRQCLYKALCPSINPRLDVIGAIIKAFGFKIRIEAETDS